MSGAGRPLSLREANQSICLSHIVSHTSTALKIKGHGSLSNCQPKLSLGTFLKQPCHRLYLEVSIMTDRIVH